MAQAFRVACVQPNGGQDMAANIGAASELVRAARAEGAQLIALPENAALMEHRGAVVRAQAAPLEQHPARQAFGALARETGAWLLVGSLGAAAAQGKVANRSVLLDDTGAVVASYDKIHMFDVDLPNGESHRESALFQPGEQAVVAATPWGKLGLTVCYDLRFPQLYRALAHAGADVISVPAAFTKVTGEAHWHVLLRARAIECGSYVIAPNQCGSHSGGRRTYGHSLIVDPWGEVLADGGEGVGYIVADIDPAKIARARGAIPALAHDRTFQAPGQAPGEAPTPTLVRGAAGS